MFREKIDRLLSSRIFYIVFSLVAAIAIWMYVDNDVNPDVIVPVSGIEIEYKGTNVVNDKNLILTNVSADSLTVRFSGKRGTVSKLLKTKPTAVVDLSQISGAGTYQLAYSIQYPNGVDTSAVTVSGGTVSFVTVFVEKLVDKIVPVEGIYNGGTQDGFSAKPVEFSPHTITISGPENEVSGVKKAWVTIQRENLAKTVEENMDYILLDENEKEFKSDYITSDTDQILVKIPVVMKKELPLKVNVLYGAGSTEENTIVTIEPAAITLTGEASVLSDLNYIVLGTIDTTKFSATSNEQFTVAIPNGAENVTGVSDATVKTEISGLSTTKLSVTDIQISNVTDGYRAELITQSLDVTLRGPKEILEEIDSDNVRITADLSDLGETVGSFGVAAKVYVDGFTDVGAIGNYLVNVKIAKGIGDSRGQ